MPIMCGLKARSNARPSLVIACGNLCALEVPADARGTPIATGQYAAYPALRAQPSMYLVARLTSFHKHLPNDTTNDFIMGGVAQTLDEQSIQAIAAWLSSLTPAGF
jgi:cytochrome c553